MNCFFNRFFIVAPEEDFLVNISIKKFYLIVETVSLNLLTWRLVTVFKIIFFTQIPTIIVIRKGGFTNNFIPNLAIYSL